MKRVIHEATSSEENDLFRTTPSLLCHNFVSHSDCASSLNDANSSSCARLENGINQEEFDRHESLVDLIKERILPADELNKGILLDVEEKVECKRTLYRNPYFKREDGHKSQVSHETHSTHTIDSLEFKTDDVLAEFPPPARTSLNLDEEFMTSTGKGGKHWFTPEMERLKARKKKLYKNYIITKLLGKKYEPYVSAKRSLPQKTREAKKKWLYEQNMKQKNESVE